MRSEGKKVNLGWLSVVVGLVVFSVIGLRIDVQEEQFDMSGDHLWANVAWMITATIFVLMMTPGLSFFYGGMVRSKNVISTMLQSFIVMGFVSVIWVVFGFGLAFGDDVCHVIGNPSDFFMFRNVGVRNVTDPAGELSQIGIVTTTIPLALFALFQMKFAIITPSLITGAFAERVHFTGYLLFMVLWTILVYCPLAHCTWHPEGLFGMLHVHDFAGGIVVHAASGIAALAGAMFLGKRRTSGNESSKPANVPFVLLGAALLWLGWFGFNGGSSLAADGIAVSAFLNTNTAAATAMVAWIALDGLRGRKPSAMGAAIGAVVGLVAITPCAGWVTVGESIFIAFFITVCCNMAVCWKGYSRVLDDALDVFPTHGLGGIIGTVLTGIFAYDYFAAGDPEMISRGEFFMNHIIVLAGVFVYTFAVSYGLYWLTNKIVPMRVSGWNERVGLDSSQHGEEYGSEAAMELPSEADWFKGVEEN
ncbi:ammonium transporter [uncultured Duncaniella sp.]|uniref:ammonium transporter n=1 Tax=uncultured Duncaniella sp. TaxID=2768039 RepID=UPI0025D5FB3A|nr:ammonium transporter [uncultured Duncaniella sp.]